MTLKTMLVLPHEELLKQERTLSASFREKLLSQWLQGKGLTAR
jgi:hypothetical protein